MKPILSYMLTDNKCPTLEDIQLCCTVAKRDNCVIRLVWFVQYSGWYDVLLYPDSNPEETFENEVPQIYGL